MNRRTAVQRVPPRTIDSPENRLPVCRVGGDLRFDKRELDAWVHGFGSAIEYARKAARL